MEEAAKYLLVASAAIALFTFLTVSHWISTRSNERRDRDRLALIRKMAELPPPAAETMRQALREEDARQRERAAQRAARQRRDGIQAGVTLIATGVGLSLFLYLLVPQEYVWAVGIMIIFIGIATGGGAYFQPVDVAQGRNRQNGEAQDS
jgi:Flp pilus assembly protein TadB